MHFSLQFIVPLFLLVLSFSIVFVPFEQWLLLYNCRNSQETVDWDSCRANSVAQKETSLWTMTFTLCSTIPSILMTPLLGGLSDLIGRKMILQLTILSGILNVLSVLLTSMYQWNLWFIALTRFISGILGSLPVFISVTFAAISDVTSMDQRTLSFVWTEATFFLAFTIGPLLGGYLTRQISHGLELVFYISLGLQLLLLGYMAIFFQETKVPTQFELRKAVKSTLESTFSLFYKEQSWNRLIILSVMLVLGLQIGSVSTFFLYAANRFGWDSLDQGIYLFVVSTSRMFYMLLVYPLIRMLWKQKDFIPLDILVLRLSMILFSFGFMAMGLAQVGWLLVLIVALDGFGTLATPILRGLLSSTVSDEMQGSLFSFVGVVQQIGMAFSSILYPIIWAHTVDSISLKPTFLFVQSLFALLAFLGTLFLDMTAFNLESKPFESQDEEDLLIQDEPNHLFE